MKKQRAGHRTNRSGKQRVKQALRNRQLLGIIGGTVLLVVVAMLGLSALERAVGLRVNDTYVAFILGAAVTATIFVLVGLTVVFSGGVNWMVGAQAERWTDEVLRRLGPEWKIAHNLEFTEGDPPDTWEVDVDHVAVGPGGVLVVESKYSSDPVDLDAEKLTPHVRKAANQVAGNARRVRSLFADMPAPPAVTSLVIFWGFRVTTPKSPIRLCGRQTHMVMGADADRWLSTFSGNKLEPESAQEAWRRIETLQAASVENM